MIEGEDVPKYCKNCDMSYWEEMATSHEAAFCGKYNQVCGDAIRQCDKILGCMTCNDCPRYYKGG